jgi:RHS repeat-associated protein
MSKQIDDASKSSQFLKTDGGKTKSNSIEVPSISLPKGGGALKGIDEKFSVNAVNGTASFSIPLPFSQARGASPALSLSYNSGGGNGVFGLGWNLDLPSIKRKTDKGLPQYDDATDSDTFLFSGAEDLVPEFKKVKGIFYVDGNGDYIINEADSTDTNFRIRYYKPRIEGLFARIERWTEKATGTIKWRVITKDNLTTLFGWTLNSVISDPESSEKTFEWLPEFVFDDKGNCSQYIYKIENADGFDNSLLHNRNRFENAHITYTNLYLEKILYGNINPYKKLGDAFPAEQGYLFSTVFDYGTLQANDSVDTINTWDFRTDAFSDYKAGFEIRTTRLCKRVLLFHVFDELAFNPDKSDKKTLIKSINFDYDTASQQDFTFLKSITAFGYIKKADGSYSSKKLPATEFEYQKHDWNRDVKTISEEDLIPAPAGLDEQQYQFTDLFNEGLSGILTEQANGWYYKHNLGGGKFEQAKLVTPKPSFNGLGGHLQLADLDADGGKQLVSYGAEPKGYFELDDDNEWQPFRYFQNLPNIDFGDANTRMLDLNGDGMPEVLITEDNIFTWYQSEGRNGFSQAHRTLKPYDEEAGPHIVFSDPKQTIFLADMSGDGMTDIARIRNGEVCYWPNLGYGKFGAKVAMDNAPLFDFPDSFNPAFLRLADIDGSGTPDIIYLGKNKFTCWMNLSGNRFNTTPFEIDAFPDVHNQAKITATDLLGNGVACIVWSSSLAKDGYSPLRYIDLMNSKKPHIMVSYKNNLGKEVSMEYTPSTKFYIEDKLAGKPWVTKLHFPVHCISKTVTVDKISGWRFVSSYKYHHGYYDHPEREFRGFGMVEQTDSEHFEHWVEADASNIADASLHQEPVVSKSWVHTGAFLRKEKILNQFAHEYWYEEMIRQGFPVGHHEVPLPDAHIVAAPGIPNTIIDHLSAQEWREALRACKGMPLRSEVFAHDAPFIGATPGEIEKQLTPYSVATHNCVIELLQPKGKNKHAIFVVKESEAITYSYERNIADPRIAHNLNIKLDEYGNVLESVAVVYPRDSVMLGAEIAAFLPDVFPSATDEAQRKTIILYTQHQFTNDIFKNDTNDVPGVNTYRLRLPSEVKTFELQGVSPTGVNRYTIADFETILNDATDIQYHDLAPTSGAKQKRLIEHIRTTYYDNDLNLALPLHQLESLALPFESYQLAYTKDLLNEIYSLKKTDSELVNLMGEGKFIGTDNDTKWWIPSGTVNFIDVNDPLAEAQDRFYLPISYTDPYSSITKVKYGNYFLFVEETEDAMGNKSGVDLFNFRTLSPQRMRDMNNNLSEAISDELGLVKAMAIFGKGNEADDLTGLTEFTEAAETAMVNAFFTAANSVQLKATGKDLLQHATARFVYDFDVYKNTGRPAVVASIVREEHFAVIPDSPIQLSFEYSNGLDKVVMKKVQAEPGKAKQVSVGGNNAITITETDTSPFLRWIGNGRTILNNKGNPVKQYEPYFSVTPAYEDFKELVETGVTPIMYYDAMGRLVKTEMPDGTFSKVEFDSWKQIIYDANDTVKDSDWYTKRMALTAGDPEITAAEKAATHYNTPSQLHFDTLGRPVLQIKNNGKDVNGFDILYKTKIELDVEGNLRKVTDARELPENRNLGNAVMQYKYDMLGNLVYQNSMDAGQRWLLHNILGKPLRTWDERDHEFRYEYDILHRPTYSVVIGGDGDLLLNNVFERVIYGEDLLLPGRTNEVAIQALNIIGKPIQHFDTGGAVLTPKYDFKGQPIFTSRKLFSGYKAVANWTNANWTDPNLLAGLEADEFTFTTETDALGRITKQTAPDGSIITPAYNEAGLLDGEKVNHFSPATNTYDGDKEYIINIDYNEKGQRHFIKYGNGVKTTYEYDTQTFRLTHLKSNINTGALQNLFYTYDPFGNITRIEDQANDTSFFNNMQVEPVSEYTYDALYRLVKASGRENTAGTGIATKDNWNDVSFMQQVNPNDPLAVRNYSQAYQYDEVGNIMQMQHLAVNNYWTRQYNYENTNNRLINTVVGSQPAYTYPHHPQHGFMTEMPHLDVMGWNFKEELVKTIRQSVSPGNGTAETTYYQYDGQGQRIRKITENYAQAHADPTKKDERIYIAGYETYRTYDANNINFERTSLSLLDEGHRFVMVETVKQNVRGLSSPPLGEPEGVGARLTRYQLHNHLSSAALELDDTARVISYEEYHPFGTTAYQANNATIKAAAKRYRYTGMERDEETGLEYHSARYYLPWLGRWLSCDPIGIGDGVNVYVYVKNRPIKYFDGTGTQSIPAKEQFKYAYLQLKLQPLQDLQITSISNTSANKSSKLKLPETSLRYGNTPGNIEHPPFLNQLYGSQKVTYYNTQYKPHDKFSIDEPNTFLQLQITRSKNMAFNLLLMKQKFNPDHQGFKLEALTAIEVGKAFTRKIVSNKMFSLSANFSVSAGISVAQPKFEDIPGTVEKSPLTVAGYRPVGISATAILRLDATIKNNLIIFMAGNIHHYQGIGKINTSVGPKLVGYLGSTEITVGIGFNIGKFRPRSTQKLKTVKQ